MGVRRCVKKGPGGSREPAGFPGSPTQPARRLSTKVFQQAEETGSKDSGGPLASGTEDSPRLTRTVWNNHSEPHQEEGDRAAGGEHVSVSRHFPRLTEGPPSTLA